METVVEGALPTVAQLACPILTKENIDEYCYYLQTIGRQKVTCKKYKRILYQFWQFLAEEKRIESDSLQKWRHHLLNEGVASRQRCCPGPGTDQSGVSSSAQLGEES